MRKFVTLASIVVLAASAAACGQSSNSATDILSLGSPVSPSALEARTGATGGKGGGKGGGGTTSGGGGSLSLVMVTDLLPSGESLGDRVTFAVSTTATTMPWVTVKCYQGGTLVLQQSKGIFPTSLGQIFTLGPTTLWQSGGADCTATLENWYSYSKNGSITALASISFPVAPAVE